ncbi:MAG: HAD hydrolase-like protein [Flammeovirgaceae bacterium]|jgi:putative hydrolase of the HAD superfamily|nr:HAD hydrolase-like protein [Flammeovirgaceae bacterium]
MSLTRIKVIAFDADDTLWHNEHYFQEVEHTFCTMLEEYLPQHTVERELLQTEIKNVSLYGYGIKSFILSMIETAIRISDKTIQVSVVERIIQLGREMLDKPIEKMDSVDEVLHLLKDKYRLVVATKGDLLDQERKLKKSGLEHFFHHIEIMSEKGESDYAKLIKHLDIKPEEFLMIGNSLKSDVLPVLALGGHGFHIPYHITWGHEKVDKIIDHPNFKEFSKLSEIVDHL